jgi:gliding motility-associated-like protein
MKKLLLAFTTICSLAFSQAPVNDDCSGAINLGTLGAPGGCGSGIKNGTTATLAATNVNATPENPYTSQAGCSGTPANNVWYTFTAPANGFGVNIVVSGAGGTLSNPQISLWSGTCAGGFAPAGCASGAGGTATLSLGGILVPGTTYYISISGTDATQSGAFTLNVNAFQDCSDCLNAGHITANPLPVNGGYLPGQVVNFCFHVDQWTQANLNYLHGVQLTFGSGWDLTTLTTTAPATYLSDAANNTGCSGSCGAWAYYAAGCTNSSSGVHYGPGFYHNGSYLYNSGTGACSCYTSANPGGVPSSAGGGDGSADLGNGAVITPPANQWNFCWSIQVLNTGCNPGSPLTVTVTTTGDGQSGDYTSTGCAGDQPLLFNAVQACCPPSVAATTPVICNGGSTGVLTATATTGVSGNQDPYVFNWTGPSGSIATNTVTVGTTNSVSGLPAGTYTVVVTDKNLCSATSTLIVSQPTAVTATLVPTNVTCAASGKITTTPGGGTPGYTYSWAGPSSYTSTAQSPTGLAAGVYTLTLSDSKSCTYTATVTVGQTGTVTAGIGSSSTTGCVTNTFTFTNTGTPAVTYSWNYGDGSAIGSGSPVSHIYASQGTYAVTETVTSGNCTATAVATVSVIASPTVGATPSSYTTCVNSPVTFSTTSNGNCVWTPTVGMTGSTSTNPTVTPSAAGTTIYSVTATASGCSSSASTVTLTVNPLPPTPTYSLPTGANNSYCYGSPTPLSVNSGTSTAVWYYNNTVVNVGSTFTPSATYTAGNYVFSIIDSVAVPGGCINASQSANTLTLSLTVNPLPGPLSYSLPTGPDTSVCQGTPVTMTVNSGTNTAVWYSNGVFVHSGSSYSPSTATAGTYTYSLIDSIPAVGGCTNASPSANTFTLSLTVKPLPGPLSYSLPTGPDTSVCQGSPVTMTVNSGTNTAAWYSNGIFVHSGSSFTLPGTLPANTYIFSVIDSIPAVGGCTNASPSANTFTLSLTVNPVPGPLSYSLPTGPDTSVCQGTPVTMTVNSGTNTAVWYSNGVFVHSGSSYNPSTATAGTYTYSLIDSIPAVGGCTNASPSANTFTLSLTVNPLPGPLTYSLPTGPDTSYCQGLPVPLTVNSGTTTAIWYYNNAIVNTGSTYTPPANWASSPVPYVLSIINTNTVTGCTSAQTANTLTINVTVNPVPTVTLTGAQIDTAKCGKPTGGVSGISVSNVSGGTPGYNFQWFSGGQPIAGATSPVLSGQPAGSYSLQITDANHCVANVTGGSTTFSVPAIAQPTAAFSTTPGSNTGQTPFHIVFTNQSTNVTSTTIYTWTFGDGHGGIAHDTNYTYTNVGTYTATLYVTNGTCKDSTKVTIVTEVPTTLIIPNIFTPNGDGINDVFFIVNTGMVSLSCDIYNRWGQLLHTLTAPNQGWDGLVPNGDKAPDGTYMYILQAQGLDGKTYKQDGTVTLIR